MKINTHYVSSVEKGAYASGIGREFFTTSAYWEAQPALQLSLIVLSFI